MKVLRKKFYARKTNKVAKEMLGKILVRKIGRKVLSGKIVETEAYFGKEDPASRAHLGWPKYCVEMLYGKVGKTLIYMVHGNWLLNVVAHGKGKGGAVLIRAIQPLQGIEEMMKNRKVDNLLQLTNGPGKLTKALKITIEQNGLDVTDPKSEVLICDKGEKVRICSSKRIGVRKDLDVNLRFYIKDNEFVSR